MRKSFKCAALGIFLGGLFLVLSLNQSSAQGIPSPEDVDCGDYRLFDRFEIRQNGLDTDYIPHCKKFTKSGNGLVAGMKWIVGYNVKPGSSIEFQERAQKVFREKVARSGHSYDEEVNFDKYNFLLGIADADELWLDAYRVIRDQFSNGQFSAKHQELYNNLKHRKFTKLGCHSNGAMTCLAALENKDVQAYEVTLYGPQVTLESLIAWQGLLNDGIIHDLTIYINEKDAIPIIAIHGSREEWRQRRIRPESDQSDRRPTNAEETKTYIESMAVSVRVRVFPCPYSDINLIEQTKKCHSMKVYTANESALERGRL